MKNVIVRSLSGIVYVGLIVGAVLGGPLWFCALLTLFGALAIYEFASISIHISGAKREGEAALIPYSIILDFVLLMMVLSISVLKSELLNLIALFAIPLYLPLRICAGLYEYRTSPLRTRVIAIAMSVLTTAYLCLAFGLISLLETIGEIYFVLNIFILIWLNDTGAFCFGTLLGRRRLWPELSPKKSWEGFWGGMLTCIVYGCVCYFCGVLPKLDIVEWIVLAVAVSVFSTWGDLFESMLKRAANMKDSGHIIPGHGGILDRIDSLLLVAPVVSILSVWMVL